MAKILFFNGPPGSGKDELARYLREKFPDRVRLYKMTAPMDDALRAFFGMTEEEYYQYRESTKDKPFPYSLTGDTMRKVLIDFSEKWAKRLFGRSIFGILAVPRLKRLVTDNTAVIITDVGFDEEAQPILQEFGVSSCYLVKIGRPDKTFRDDSRTYLGTPHWRFNEVFSLENDGTKIEWYTKGKDLIRYLDSEYPDDV